MTFKPLALATSVALLSMTAQMALANDHMDDGVRQVSQVVWDKSGQQGFTPLPATQISKNQSNLVFIRPLDNDGLQTSANIGIDDRFQVSLQGGYYSQILECAGSHQISVTTTGEKHNDLSEDSKTFMVKPQKNHYFYVEVNDSTGQPSINEITEETALNVLGNKWEQTHQISRVSAQCAMPQAVVVTPPPVVVNPKPVSPPAVTIDAPISLDVLFKFDSDTVQPIYNQKIEDVAEFMRQYPNTVTRIEGHTDSIGSRTYNMSLSQRRADAVKDELVNRYGADTNRLTTIGYGESRPVATNSTAEGRQQNRRVVAIISNQ